MSNLSTRDRLVRAGVELLEEAGTVDISLRAIARRAGVSHGAPRRWFATHRILLASIAEVGLRDLAADLEAASLQPPDTPTETPIIRFANAYISFAVHRPAMFTLIFRHDLLEDSGKNLRDTSLPMFDRLVAQVRLAADIPEPEFAAATLWTGIHGIAVLATSGTLDLATSGIPVDRLVRHVVAGAINAPL